MLYTFTLTKRFPASAQKATPHGFENTRNGLSPGARGNWADQNSFCAQGGGFPAQRTASRCPGPLESSLLLAPATHSTIASVPCRTRHLHGRGWRRQQYAHL
jgi:hypothetical protein